ncbi:MAG: methylated-DNA--[protein]-cysteine S-methyltransferase, partial [Brevibacterium aurantiacum]
MSSNEVDGPHPNADSAQATMATPVGPITVTGNGRSIVRVTWVESAEVDFSAAPPASAVSDPLLTEAMRQLHAYFNGSLTTFDLPLGLGQISAVARTVLTTLDET